jgi:hypothetical protein
MTVYELPSETVAMKSKAKRTAAKKRLKSKHQNLPKSPAAATRRRKARAAKKATAKA